MKRWKVFTKTQMEFSDALRSWSTSLRVDGNSQEQKKLNRQP